MFLLPLDVANQNGLAASQGGLPMAKITLAFYASTIIMVLLVVPFTVFYYEGEEVEDEDGK